VATLSGLFTILGGRSSRSNAAGRQDEPDGWQEFLVNRGLALAAPLFLLTLVILLSWWTTAGLQLAWDRVSLLQNMWTYDDFARLRNEAHAADVRIGALMLPDYGAHLAVLKITRPSVALAIVIILLAAGGLSSLSNLNVFSLHGMYRDRLIRAYFAASRMARAPNLLTGFDDRDNLPLQQLRPAMFTLRDALALVTTIKAPGTGPIADCVKMEVLDKLPLDVRQRLIALVRPTFVDWDLGEHVVRGFNALLATLALVDAGSPVDTASPFLVDLPSWNRAVLARQYPALAQPQAIADPAQPAAAANVPLVAHATVATGAARAAGAAAGAGMALAAGAGTAAGAAVAATVTSAPAADMNTAAGATLVRAAEPTAMRALFPLINTTLNLTAGDDLAWQERKAESFLFTPLHVGGTRVGFRRTQWLDAQGTDCRYGGGGANNGVSLGTATTISGAAANPNMGYHSSPIITFLLTLFNARLGSWMGNPRFAIAAASEAPRFGVVPIASEATGYTNERRAYVNLSDGGHFENLGIYEAVRRRCHLVLVVDAGQDAAFTFEDLGNAVSKIRVDYGVPIEFVRPPDIHGRGEGAPTTPSKHGGLARIRYSCVDPGCRDGWLLYVKPAIDGDEPSDVAHYAKQHEEFPHQSTADQFFTESQFESYRALGRYTMQRILGERPVTTEAGLVCRFYRTCVTNR
jgi:hypothetical protein